MKFRVIKSVMTSSLHIFLPLSFLSLNVEAAIKLSLPVQFEAADFFHTV